MTTVAKQVSIQDFVAELQKFPEAAFRETESIRSFLQNVPVNADSLSPYLTWDRQHYTRNLIDKTALYELVAICWEVGQASSVHNHRDQNCWMAVPIGRLQVENFRVLHQDLEAGRPLEVEAVVGSVIEAAGQGNVATPRLGIIYELIRALDRSLWSTVDRSTSDT